MAKHIELKDGDKVPLITGNCGIYEEGAIWGGLEAIWDLDSAQYVPIDFIDWTEIEENPDSVKRED